VDGYVGRTRKKKWRPARLVQLKKLGAKAQRKTTLNVEEGMLQAGRSRILGLTLRAVGPKVRGKQDQAQQTNKDGKRNDGVFSERKREKRTKVRKNGLRKALPNKKTLSQAGYAVQQAQENCPLQRERPQRSGFLKVRPPAKKS